MHTTLDDSLVQGLISRVQKAARRSDRSRAGRPTARLPVQSLRVAPEHVHPDSAQRAGRAARRLLESHAPDAVVLARSLQLQGWDHLPREGRKVDSLLTRLEQDAEAVRRDDPDAWLAHEVYVRVVRKLTHTPVEELCLDFHEAYGVRPDDEEDATAGAAARAVAVGFERETLPPFVAVRIKPLEGPTAARALRTLDLFVSTLVDRAGGVPELSVVLPEASNTEQVRGLVKALAGLEQKNSLRKGCLKLVLGVDHPGTLVDGSGRVQVRALCEVSAGRCTRVDHDPVACSGATGRRSGSPRDAVERALLATALEGANVMLASSGTDLDAMPPHAGVGLSPADHDTNHRAVRAGWLANFRVVTESLADGVLGGVDRHVGQLPARYAAWVVHSLSTLDEQLSALKLWVIDGRTVADGPERLWRGQARLDTVLRGLDCGALLASELRKAGLDDQDLAERSSRSLLDRRRPAETS